MREQGQEADVQGRKNRARGCLLGQVAGDSLGSLVEFCSPREILNRYPDRVTELEDGGLWHTIAGQPTDDSEMALALARSLVRQKGYDIKDVRQAYVDWKKSGPVDIGCTIADALSGHMRPESEANGAMMRSSPLGIFGAAFSEEQTARWADADAALTHISPVCRQTNVLFVLAIAHAVATGCSGDELYAFIANHAESMSCTPKVLQVIRRAADERPTDYMTHSGWVMIAFQNALWQLTHAATLEEAVIDTVMHGGDTDTNAAICGALLGAVHGCAAVPTRWREKILACRPDGSNPRVERPRPQCFWPTDILELADRLVDLGTASLGK